MTSNFSVTEQPHQQTEEFSFLFCNSFIAKPLRGRGEIDRREESREREQEKAVWQGVCICNTSTLDAESSSRPARLWNENLS